jgi:hypothetical protein
MRLVGADIAAAHNRNEAKRVVAEILREEGPLPTPTLVRRPKLHLVRNDKDAILKRARHHRRPGADRKGSFCWSEFRRLSWERGILTPAGVDFLIGDLLA